MQKILILLLIILMSISCSSKSSDANSENKITVWHVQSADIQGAIFNRAKDRFLKEYPDYTVDMNAMKSDAYKTQIQIAVGANSAPDIFVTWGGGTMLNYIKANKIIDLAPYMSQNGFSNKFIPASLLQVSVDDKIYAVPVEAVTIAMVFYNKKLFEENGWTVPTTLTELESLCDKMLAKGIKPFALANKTKWPASMIYMSLVQRIGGTKVFYDAANRVNGGSFENPAFIEAAKKFVEWVDKGYFNEGFNGLDYNTGQGRALMYTGKTAMEINGSFLTISMLSENPDFFNNNLDAFIFPAIEGSKANPKELIGSAGDMFYCISSTSKNPDMAFKLLERFVDDQAVKENLDIGIIPPIKNASPEGTISKKIAAAVNEATAIQLWYDQYLPPELAQVHMDTLQAVIGKTMTPEEACKQLEAKALELLGPSSK